MRLDHATFIYFLLVSSPGCLQGVDKQQQKMLSVCMLQHFNLLHVKKKNVIKFT